MGPEIGVRVDDRAVRNIENLSHGDGEEREGSELGVFLEIVQRAGLGLGQDALERKRLGAWRRGCGRLRLAKRDDGQAGQD